MHIGEALIVFLLFFLVVSIVTMVIGMLAYFLQEEFNIDILKPLKWVLNSIKKTAVFVFKKTTSQTRQTVLKKNCEEIPYNVMKHPLLQMESTLDEWYLLSGDNYTLLKHSHVFKNIKDHVAYTGIEEDEIKIGSMRSGRNGHYSLRIKGFTATHNYSAYYFDEDDFYTLHNARTDKTTRIEGQLMFYFLLYLTLDEKKEARQDYLDSIANNFSDLQHKANMDYRNRQTEKTLKRIDLPDSVKEKVGRIDVDRLQAEDLPEDFKDSCIKYNEAYDELHRYDKLGEDIFAIGKHPLEGKDKEEE